MIDSTLRPNYRYREELNEVVRTPDFMLIDLENQGYCEGDCDDISTLICACAMNVGISSRLTAIRSNQESNVNNEFDHVFSEIKGDGVQPWTPVDLTVPSGTVYVHRGMVHEYVR